jgi:lipopolysaccharide export system permease protein
MSSPSVIFEMFPFIFLIGTQFFFIKLFTNDEINIFKYSGLKNVQIIKILSLVSFFNWNICYYYILLVFFKFTASLYTNQKSIF